MHVCVMCMHVRVHERVCVCVEGKNVHMSMFVCRRMSHERLGRDTTQYKYLPLHFLFVFIIEYLAFEP